MDDYFSMTSVIESLYETNMNINKDQHKKVYNTFIQDNFSNVKKAYPKMNDREILMYIGLMWDIKQTNI